MKQLSRYQEQMLEFECKRIDAMNKLPREPFPEFDEDNKKEEDLKDS